MNHKHLAKMRNREAIIIVGDHQIRSGRQVKWRMMRHNLRAGWGVGDYLEVEGLLLLHQC
jgi:hypothetical protein